MDNVPENIKQEKVFEKMPVTYKTILYSHIKINDHLMKLNVLKNHERYCFKLLTGHTAETSSFVYLTFYWKKFYEQHLYCL